MLIANYSSVPEIKTPLRTLVIISVITLGIGYLYWQYTKMQEDEKSRTL